MSAGSFTFRDGSRTIVFGPGVGDDVPDLLERSGFEDWVLLTTERAAAEQVPGAVANAAAQVVHVPSGPVPEIAAAVRGDVRGWPLVAFGGGRVVDAAKAIGAADGVRVAAVPTTLAGSTFTPFHRMPAGVEGYGSTRPELALCDPALMASAPLPGLAATAMNALAHAIESTYAPGANPVAEGAALRGIAALGAGLRADPPGQSDLALGALLGGYAVGVAGLCVHHAVCQTIVRVAGTPHALTNAVVLPHSVAFMAGRAPEQIARVGEALGGQDAPGAVAELAALAGPTTLTELGLGSEHLDEIVGAATDHPGAQATPGGVGPADIRELVTSAL